MSGGRILRINMMARVSPPVTVSLNAYDDTWLDSNGPTTTHGADTFIAMGGPTEGTTTSSFARKGLMRFDISTIPAGSKTHSAILRLVLSAAGGGGGAGIVLSAKRCKRAYVYNQANFNTYSTGNSWGSAGALNDNDRGRAMWGSGAVPNNTIGTVVNLDIGPVLQEAINLGLTTLDLFLVAPTGTISNNTVQVASSRHATSSFRPTLTITYANSALIATRLGTGVTYIDGNAQDTNNEADPSVVVAATANSWDATSFTRHGLATFDIAGTPTSSTTVWLALIIRGDQAPTTVGSNGFQARECLRIYNSSQTTWNIFSTSNNWQTSGAQGVLDRGSILSPTTAFSGVLAWGRPVFINVTSLVQNMQSSSQTTARLLFTYLTSNNGIRIWDNSEDPSTPTLFFVPSGVSLPEHY